MSELEKLRKQVADLSAKVKGLEEKEKILQESERRHRLINELVPDMILSFVMKEDDKPWIIDSVLGGDGRITGYTIEESRAFSDWEKAIHPDDWHCVLEAMEDLMANRTSEFEVRFVSKAGKVTWHRVAGVPDWDSDKNRLKGGYWWAKDISEQKLAEEALRRRKRQFHTISEFMSDLIIEIAIDPDGEMEIKGPILGEIGNISGFTQEEVRHFSNWGKAIHPDDHGVFDEVSRALRAGEPREYDVRTVGKNGEIRWQHARSIPDLDEKTGRVVGGLIQVQDITDRKLAEEALRQKERHFRMISEFVSDLIIEVEIEADGTTEVKEVILGRLGEPGGYREEDVRSSDNWTKLIHPDDRAIADRASRDLLKGKASDYELRIVGTDGAIRWLEVRSIPDLDGKKKSGLTGFIMLKDITDKKRVAGEMLRLERLRALGQMAAGVSHNLNNILTTIIGPARLLEKDLTDPALRQETEYIIRSARRARDLVRRLNEAVSGGVDANMRNISVNKVVQEAVDLTRSIWKDEAESRGVDILVKTELGEVPPVRGTRSGLLDILVNLLLNAVDAMPGGGEIAISTEAADGGLLLAVSDGGVGMNEQTLKRAFEPFFTTKSEIGTGLGLSTVFSTITRWGGTVDVQSSPGKGAKFVFTLPASGGEETGGAVTKAPLLSRRAKILVVEDVEPVRLLFSRMLSGEHEVTLVADGEEALRYFASEEYDVAVIDLGLAEIPGDRIGRLLRQTDPLLVTVLISGWELPEDDPRVKGFDFRMQKPFDDLDQVRSVIAQAVNLRDARQESRGAESD